MAQHIKLGIEYELARSNWADTLSDDALTRSQETAVKQRNTDDARRREAWSHEMAAACAARRRRRVHGAGPLGARPHPEPDILLDVTNAGLWMAHCHIAEHNQSGMMFSFPVTEGT
jgi:hypothetical protein